MWHTSGQKMLLLNLFVVLLTCAAVNARRPILTYNIDLDLEPSQRYVELISDSKNGFNKTVWSFYNTYFANDKILTDVLYGISDKRGPEPNEMQGEIQGLSDLSGLPLKFVQSIQMLYELQTLMVPIVNFTKVSKNTPKVRTFLLCPTY